MSKQLQRARVLLEPFKWAFLITVILTLLNQVLVLVGPYFFGKVIDALSAGSPWRVTVQLIVVAAGAYLLQNLAWLIFELYTLKKIDFKISLYVDDKTMRKILDFSVGQNQAQNSGWVQSVINKGQHSLLALSRTLLYQVTPLVFKVVLTALAVFWIDLRIGAFLGLTLLAHAGTSLMMSKKFGGRIKEVHDEGHRISKVQNELIRNMDLVQLSSMEEETADLYYNRGKELAEESINLWSSYVFPWHGIRMLIAWAGRLGVVALGSYFFYTGNIGAGDVVVLAMWSGNALSGLSTFARIHRQILNMKTEVERYLSMLDIESDIKVVSNPVRLESPARIHFDNVSFRYPRYEEFKEQEDVRKEEGEKRPLVLRGVSFEVKKGEKTALVGSSGAGKSTVINLMLRAFDPTEGRILVDGEDLRLLDPKSLRSSVGYVEQSVRLFDETIRFNILFGLNGDAEKVTDDEVRRVMVEAGLEDLLAKLPKGLDTLIGENGIKLSGGERQRVGIARALVKKPSIIILDEATSNLDSANEYAVKEAIARVTEGKTTVAIAHRLSTVIDSDKIVVLEDGQIVGVGTHEELLRSCEAYQKQVNHQLLK